MVHRARGRQGRLHPNRLTGLDEEEQRDYLFLFSWTLTGSTDDILDLQLLSSAASPQLSKALHALEAARPNIVYLDQLDPWLSSRIIAVTPRTP